jgi:FixJ family two-component response regulator
MPAGKMSKVVVIIDDDDSVRDSLCDLVESAGIEVECFASAKAFLESDSRGKVACLILDIRMPRMSGLDLQARLKQEGSNIPIIFVSAYNDPEIQAQAMKGGAAAFLAKPFDHRPLLKTVRGILDGETLSRAPRAIRKESGSATLFRPPAHGI